MVLGHFGPFGAKLDKFGRFSHNCTGAHINEQKLKHDLDHQMSAYMVQENHQENISTQLNQCKILVYFGTIYMEHPVDSGK